MHRPGGLGQGERGEVAPEGLEAALAGGGDEAEAGRVDRGVVVVLGEVQQAVLPPVLRPEQQARRERARQPEAGMILAGQAWAVGREGPVGILQGQPVHGEEGQHLQAQPAQARLLEERRGLGQAQVDESGRSARGEDAQAMLGRLEARADHHPLVAARGEPGQDPASSSSRRSDSGSRRPRKSVERTGAAASSSAGRRSRNVRRGARWVTRGARKPPPRAPGGRPRPRSPGGPA